MNAFATRARRGLSQARATATALAVAGATEVGLHTLPLPRLSRLLGTPLEMGAAGQEPKQLPSGSPVVLIPRERRQVRTALRLLKRWPLGDTCLRQALVCGFLLRHRHPALHIGVAKLDGEVRAHAWLTVGDSILDPIGSASSYLLLEPLPDAPA